MKKETNTIQQAAFVQSAKCMWSALLLLFVMLVPQGAWAQDVYISHIKIAGSGQSKEKGKNEAKGRLNGWSIIDWDLNTNTGGWWIYVGYRTTTDASKAIREIIMVDSDVYDEGYREDENGTNYYIMIDKKRFYRAFAEGTADLNRGGGGATLTLYYTRDGNHAPISILRATDTYGTAGYDYVPRYYYSDGKWVKAASAADCSTNYSNGSGRTCRYLIAHSHSYNGTTGLCSSISGEYHGKPATSGSGTSASPYQLANVGNLLWFSEKVNGSYEYANGYKTTATFKEAQKVDDACSSVTYKDPSACATLTADINYKSLEFETHMIGNSSENAYKGTFNGNNKTVTVGFNCGKQYSALFRYANGATIQNLCVNGTILTSAKYAAGICARTEGSAVNLNNVISDVELFSIVEGDGTHGGMVATADAVVNFTNCLVTGKFRGSSTTCWGGFIGWTNVTNTFSNCYLNLNSESNNGTKSSNLIVRNQTVSSGVSYASTSASRFESVQGTSVNASIFTSGELCYKLNGSVNGGGTWRQNITSGTTDANPVLNQSHGKIYYWHVKYCDGTDYYYYTNSSTTDTDYHKYNSNYTIDKQATCTTEGSKSQHCINTKCTSKINVTAISATGHSWGDASWSWNTNGQSATCTRTCSNDESHKATASLTLDNGITSKVKTIATCTTKGWTTYSAKATVVDTEYNDTKELEDIAIDNDAHNINANGLCTLCGKLRVNYRVPTYKTEGDPSSGIISWSMQNVMAAQVTASTSQVTWRNGWYYVSGEVSLTQGAVCSGAVNLILCDNAKLTVTGADRKAGIRVSGSGNSLTIYAQSNSTSMGALSVKAGKYAAGIGGNEKEVGSNITINGGTITATGGTSGAAGIGGGEAKYGTDITVNAGAVTAIGSSYCSGIGGGNGGRGPENKNFFISTALGVMGGSSVNNTSVIANDGTDLASSIKALTCITIHSIHNYATPTWKWADDGSSAQASFKCSFNETLVLTPTTTPKVTVTSVIGTPATCTTTGTATCNASVTFDGTTYTAPSKDVVLPVLGHNFVNGACTNNGCTAKLNYRVPTYKTGGAPQSGIASWSTQQHTGTATRVASSDSQVTWTAGWYYITGNVTLTKGAVCSGAVNLILCDDAKLTVTSTDSKAGVQVSGSGNSLTIYAQSENNTSMGILSVNGGKNAAAIGGGENEVGSNITINGGAVTATGGSDAAGIGGGNGQGGSDITINGGIISAAGGANSSNGIGGNSQSTNIIFNTALAVMAGTSANPSTLIDNDGTDLASSVQGMRYVTVHTHEYGLPTWTWAKDGSSASVAFKCAFFETLTMTPTTTPAVSVTSYIKTAPSCTEKGWTVYVATATINDTQYRDTLYLQNISVNTDPSAHVFDSDGACTGKGCTARQVSYRKPVYNIPGDPASGVASWTTDTALAYKAITNTGYNNWSTGWYYISGNSNPCAGAICNGDVHLILCDGGYSFIQNRANPGIRVNNGSSLTIYSQSDNDTQENLRIDPGEHHAGIGSAQNQSCSNITINGGKIWLRGGFHASAIGGGDGGSASNIVINGGSLTCLGGYLGSGIGGGYGGSSSNIFVNTVYDINQTAYDGGYRGALIPNNGKDISSALKDEQKILINRMNSMTRTMTNAWGTIVLPFDVSAESDGYDFYSISSVSDNVLYLTKQTGTLSAGTPVLVRMSEAAKDAETGKYNLTLTAANTTFNTTITNPEAVDGLTLTGTYSLADVTNGYILANNAFWNATTLKGNDNLWKDSEGQAIASDDRHIYCYPFHAYLAGEIAGVEKILLKVVGDKSFTIADVRAVADILLGKSEVSDISLYDIDRQSGLDIADLTFIIKCLNEGDANAATAVTPGSAPAASDANATVGIMGE